MRTVLVLSGGGCQGLALVKALRRLPQLRIVRSTSCAVAATGWAC